MDPTPRRSYHHGDLRRSLIESAGALLAERGVDGFSLREVARRAGVSAAAPAHHFGDAGGLLTVVSTLAFEELALSLREGEARGGDDARSRLIGQGLGYVGFALRRPGHFRLMFRSGQLHPDAALQAAGAEAFGVLEDGIRRLRGIAPGAPLDAGARAAALAMWSLVHGFAHLAIAQRFDAMAGQRGLKAWVRRTLPQVLDAAIGGIVPVAGAASGGSPATRRRTPRGRVPRSAE